MKYNSLYGQYDIYLDDSGHYGNGRTALRAFDSEDGLPIATFSVNLDDEDLAKDEMAIKDYSENEGCLDFLIKEGVVSEPVRYVFSGHVSIPIVKYKGIKHL